MSHLRPSYLNAGRCKHAMRCTLLKKKNRHGKHEEWTHSSLEETKYIERDIQSHMVLYVTMVAF